MTYDESSMTNAIAECKAGDVVKVVVPAGKTIKSDVFAKAKEVGTSVELVASDGKVVWNFKKITGEMKDFYADAKIGATLEDVSKAMTKASVPETLKYTTVDFTYSGQLAGEVEVSLNLSDKGYTEGQTVYFYYFNPSTERFELMDKSVYKSGVAIFKITHCSEYIVTNEELPTALTAPKTGDQTNILLFALILIIGISFIGTVMVSNCVTKKQK